MKRLFFLLCSLVSVFSSHAKAPEVSVLICGPGSNIYELEGHAGLLIDHPEYGKFVVNWGVFDFNSPNFVYRFVKGETDYMAAACSADGFIDAYKRQGRYVLKADIDLDSVQAEEVTRLVIENIKPENRVYRYNYVYDNCATRPMDVIEQVIGDTLSLDMAKGYGAGLATFRDVMRLHHASYPWYQFGIDTALGSGIDKPITIREKRFAPTMLGEMLPLIAFPDGSPLVKSIGYAFGMPQESPVLPPTPWYLTPLFWGWMVAGMALWVSVVQLGREPKFARWFDTVYFILMGLEGLVLTFLIFISSHEATSPNWLYLWLNPLCFMGAIAPWLKRGKRLEICYQSVNFALLTGLTVIFLLGIQSPNPAFWPLILASALRALTNIYSSCRKNVRTAR
ncbi:DUF4105 domain-containing protein [Duncaniella freteri]|uniref:lipoprotein N-acyltransferase Lnb domain-containing protein n=1 Tax=Duncaniella freteri TaxID=2530391 RepID=UPI0025700A74|nr:DUF4105 domain-containing protein [Duncaniella freteri]